MEPKLSDAIYADPVKINKMLAEFFNMNKIHPKDALNGMSSMILGIFTANRHKFPEQFDHWVEMMKSNYHSGSKNGQIS
jgi:hypothetical protein